MAAEGLIQWRRASRKVQFAYVFGILAVLMSSPQTGWMSRAGDSLLFSSIALASSLVVAVAIARAVQVVRRLDCLDAPVAQGPILWCRRLGLTLIALAVIAASMQLLVAPMVRAIVPRHPLNDIELLRVGLAFATFGGLASSGMLIFELSRLLGFERWHRERSSS